MSILFLYLFYVNSINPKCFLHSFGLILLVNVCIFQVSFQNKVNLVPIDVLFNLPIPHVFELLSLIPRWNRHLDNFIESIVVFADKFLSNKGVVIIMHVDDMHMLKEIHSFTKTSNLRFT
jgi:hypothetical protein